MGTRNCDRIKKLLGAYLDGELPERKARRLSEHLSACGECSRAAESYHRLASGLRSLAAAEREIQAGTSWWPRIRQELERRPRPAPGLRQRVGRIFAWPRPLWIGLALTTAAVLTFLLPTAGRSRLPLNHCQIDSITVPDNQLMIYQDKTDGFTIIWLLE